MKTSLLKTAHAAAACAALVCAQASTALAAESPESTPLNLPAESAKRTAAAGSSGGTYARLIVGLAVVLAVIYGLSWVLKQVKAAKEGSATGAGLQAVSSLPLGPNRALHLVRVGDDLVLLGVGEKGVTPIRSYTDDEARAAGLVADEIREGEFRSREFAEANSLTAAPASRRALPAPATPGAVAQNLLASMRARTVRR